MNVQQQARIRTTVPCFAELPDDCISSMQVLTVSPRTPHPIREGHRLQHAIFVIRGRIRIYSISSNGREITLYRVEPGRCCVLMLASILGEYEYEAHAEIEEESELLLVPVEQLRFWMETHPPVRQWIYRQFAQQIMAVGTLAQSIAFRSVPHRLAAYLLQQTDASGQHGDVHVTHEQLAIELGTAREVVSRVLKDWTRRGAVTLRRGVITIRERGILSEILASEA